LGEPTDLAALGQTFSLEWLFAAGAVLLISAALIVASRRPEWVVGRPWIVLALLAAVSVAATLALFRFDPPGLNLVLDPSTEPLLPRNDPAQQLYRSAVLDFGDDEVYVVAVECEEVFRAECLEAIDRISTEIMQMPEVRSISSLMDVTSFRYVAAEDWVEVRPFIEDVPTDPAELAALRERALDDPVYVRSIVSEDARTAAINIYFQKMTDAELIESRLDDRVIAILEREPALAGHAFFVSGRPHFKTHVYDGMVRDLRFVLPLSILTMVVLLALFNGSLRGVLVPLGVALSSVLWTFGAMAFVAHSLTLLTGLVGPMLLAMGCVYGVHVVTRYQEDAARAASSREAALECLRHMLVPVTIAGLTTVLGFAALLITDVPAVFELGAFSMLGIGSMTVTSLTGAPALLALLPIRSAPRSGFSTRLAARLDVVLVHLSERVTNATGVVLVAFVVLVAGMTALIPFIVIDTDYLSYFDEDDPVRLDFEAVNERLSGAVPLYIVLDGSGPGAFREPAAVGAIEEIQRRLDGLEGVGRTLSFAESMRMLNRAFHSDDAAEERIPETRGGVTELLFMIPKNELQRFTTVNHGRANVILRTGLVGSSDVLRLTREIEEQLAQVEFPAGVEARVTGNALLLARSADGIATGQPVSVAIAAISILALVALGLRSFGIGAVAMAPNVAPVLIYFGTLGMGAAPLSLPTSLIACIALGIAIDDTVHYTVRYRAERRLGASPREAALQTTRSVGRPIVITSAVISLGFLMVMLSDFATLREFGALAALTMGICLACDLVMLPAILVRSRL
jgi:predicted RND superfamily exporter protein